ncbi:MAG: hypothetical protein RLZZ347_216 [Candidatus Parcubacteria bacterium]|jgi:beta-lactamase class A
MKKGTEKALPAKHIPYSQLLLCLAVGFGAHWLLAHYSETTTSSDTHSFNEADSTLRLRGKYNLINPLLVCGNTDSKDFDEYNDLKLKIQKVINAKITDGSAKTVSVYFRSNGKWLGINENEKYSPASLNKVPIMMAYYKKAEENPGILSQELIYDGSFDQNKQETFRSEYDITPGAYTIENLIKAMIVNSDNNALILLYNNIDHNSLKEVYTDLGLSVTSDSGLIDSISAKEYSYFFRLLYNATYLNDTYSERAMELLASASFPQGIRSGIPKNTTIAQKFGERSTPNKNGIDIERELHDCGIVFNQTHPYNICIMTRGTNFEQLSNTIKAVSTVVYQEIENLK